MSYQPDHWVILKLTPKGENPWYRLFAGWRGNFVTGDSWRANSGIVKIVEESDHYAVHGLSKSVYYCGKEREGMFPYMDSVLYGWQQAALEGDRAVIEIVSVEDAMKDVNERDLT